MLLAANAAYDGPESEEEFEDAEAQIKFASSVRVCPIVSWSHPDIFCL